jgi:murein DD-endopeptidase MepM/ murein hydrolase activator NlpD
MRRFALITILLVNLLGTAQAELLPDPARVEIKKVDGSHTLFLHNPWPAPVTYRLTFILNNAVLDTPNPVTIVVPAKGSARGPVIRRDDDASGWRWDYKAFYHFGDWRKLKTVRSYALPYSRGTEYKVFQAFNGALSHRGKDAYALDFDMPEGTKVTAARDGLVVKVVEGFSQGGWDESFREKANTVILAHQDGTLSRYVHLQQNSVVVDLGDWVRTGELLGLSGNTGYSSGPHLHFDVYSPGDDMKVRTLKFQVRVNGQDITPSEGDVYRN